MADLSSSRGHSWRSKPSFVLATVTIGTFTDLFLYSIMIPVFPFMLRDHFSIPEAQIQSYTSRLIASYAGASALFSIPAGWIADQTGAHQQTFLAGLILLLIGTTMMAFVQTVGNLLIARLLQGISAAVVFTAGIAMVQDTVGTGKMGQAMGTVGTFQQ